MGVASPVAEQFKTEEIRKLGNIREVSKLHRMIAYIFQNIFQNFFY